MDCHSQTTAVQRSAELVCWLVPSFVFSGFRHRQRGAPSAPRPTAATATPRSVHSGKPSRHISRSAGRRTDALSDPSRWASTTNCLFSSCALDEARRTLDNAIATPHAMKAIQMNAHVHIVVKPLPLYRSQVILSVANDSIAGGNTAERSDAVFPVRVHHLLAPLCVYPQT